MSVEIEQDLLRFEFLLLGSYDRFRGESVHQLGSSRGDKLEELFAVSIERFGS